MIRPPPRSPLFPSTTLSRSGRAHDARLDHRRVLDERALDFRRRHPHPARLDHVVGAPRVPEIEIGRAPSELQSLAYLVCRLLLEKKKKNQQIYTQFRDTHIL